MATVYDPNHPGMGEDEKVSSGLGGSDTRTRAEKKAQKKHNAQVKEANKVLSGKDIKESKFNKLNYMTIPQLKAGRTILDKKMKSFKDGDPMIAKLQTLKNEYVNTERKINKYYEAVSRNPLTHTILRGKRDILTIATIKGGKFKGKGDKDMKYNGADFLRDIKADKIALGVGIGAMGLGALEALKFNFGSWEALADGGMKLNPAAAGDPKKSVLKFLLETLGTWIKQNPLAFAFLAGGAALIVASKVCPAIARTSAKIAKNKAMVNEAQNEISAEAATHENNMNLTDLASADFKDVDSLAMAFLDNPTLKNDALHYAMTGKRPDGQVLTTQQKMNILQAIKKSKEKEFQLKELREDSKNPYTPTPSTSTPSTSTPSTSTPSTSTPSTSTPSTSTPSTSTPSTSTPSTSTPSTSTPSTSTPSTSTPSTSTPSTSTPSTSTPSTSTPSTSTPSTSTPSTSTPSTSTPTEKPSPNVADLENELNNLLKLGWKREDGKEGGTAQLSAFIDRILNTEGLSNDVKQKLIQVARNRQQQLLKDSKNNHWVRGSIEASQEAVKAAGIKELGEV